MLELRALGALAKATTLALLAIATPSAAIPWSQPAQLGRCTAGSPPLIAFPFSTPTVATGPGAIVWSAAASCRGAAGPRVVALGPDLQPGSERRLSSVANAVPSAIAAAPHGRIVVAARRGSGGAQLLEGRANGSFSPLAMSAAEPVGLATAYLGDTGLVTASAGGGLRVQVQRHDSTSFSPARKVLAGPSRAADAQVALDFRTDQLVVWRSGDELFARYLPVEGAAGPVRRLAHVKGVVRIAALLSDNGRATVAWSQRARGTVSVYLDRSAAGPDFGMPRLLERDREPHGVAAPSHSPLLVRVADESVMMAWAGVTSGRWVVRTAPIAETLGA
ncbi:MAG TPA: hypothetical protein VH025_04445, partial [Solirubrobacteraceae bacterium]|nr:hypothetical protein [Solirubrobacteraceae bacterium]